MLPVGSSSVGLGSGRAAAAAAVVQVSPSNQLRLLGGRADRTVRHRSAGMPKESGHIPTNPRSQVRISAQKQLLLKAERGPSGTAGWPNPRPRPSLGLQEVGREPHRTAKPCRFSSGLGGRLPTLMEGKRTRRRR